MEIACDFGREYVPTERPDPALLQHLKNCPDCQEQVHVVGTREAPWSVSSP